MKKFLILGISLTLLCSSCATIFGGHVSDCQKTKPTTGQPVRQVRVAALVLDILIFWPGLIVDFADNAIYKPCNTTSTKK